MGSAVVTSVQGRPCNCLYDYKYKLRMVTTTDCVHSLTYSAALLDCLQQSTVSKQPQHFTLHYNTHRYHTSANSALSVNPVIWTRIQSLSHSHHSLIIPSNCCYDDRNATTTTTTTMVMTMTIQSSSWHRLQVGLKEPRTAENKRSGNKEQQNEHTE